MQSGILLTTFMKTEVLPLLIFLQRCIMGGRFILFSGLFQVILHEIK